MNDPNPAVTASMFDTFRQCDDGRNCFKQEKDKAIELAFQAGVTRTMHRLKLSAQTEVSKKLDRYFS